MSLQVGINLSVLTRRAIRTVKVYLMLSVVLGIVYWFTNPIGVKDITTYMFSDGISNWWDHSFMNMLWVWVMLSMYHPKGN